MSKHGKKTHAAVKASAAAIGPENHRPMHDESAAVEGGDWRSG